MCHIFFRFLLLAAALAAAFESEAKDLRALPVLAAITNASGDHLVTLRGGPDEFQLLVGPKAHQITLGAKRKNSQKRNYLPPGKGVIEAKSELGEIKIRNASGSLLCKVKLSPGKIKISDNEENKNPFLLQWKGADEVKAATEKGPVGRLVFLADKKEVQIFNTSTRALGSARTEKFSAAWGVFCFDDLPDDLRAILFAELFFQDQ